MSTISPPSLEPLPSLETGAVIVPTTAGEPLLRLVDREASILLAREQITITHARYPAGQPIAGPHIHLGHTDAFYVLEGELTFEVGSEPRTITVSQGGFIAAPPEVAHSFHTSGDRPARWLTIHAPDGGFAAFMRGRRDGVEVEWDISKVPPTGGLASTEAIVSPADGAESPDGSNQLCRLRCALPDMRVMEWQLRQQPLKLPLHHQDRRIVSFFVIEGELEAWLAGTTHTLGPGTLISLPGDERHTIIYRGSKPARILSLHTPGGRDDDLPSGSETRQNRLS